MTIELMEMEKWLALVMLVASLILMEELGVKAEDVTYDGRSLIIDGERKLLFSGSIHYPRSTPQVIKLHKMRQKCELWI